MKQITIKATLPKNEKKGRKEDKTASLNVNFVDVEGGDVALAELQKLVGAKAILSNALSNWVVTVQGTIRARLAAGKTQPEIQAELGSLKMGTAAAKAVVDPKAAFRAMYMSATPEERKKLIAELQA
jgi:N-acetylglucosamine-6-phosphate deacetylase